MERQMKRNISLVYILTALNYSWFWIAIWVLFYLRFTDYAGIGLLESVMITTSFLGEIPTGAIGDLLGKKKTLIIAFFLCAMGNLTMGLAPSFGILAMGVALTTFGGTFESGTIQAFVYDSLASIKEQEKYEKILGNLSSVRMTALGMVSIIGGYLYTISPGLPFIVLSVFQMSAVIVSFFLHEPHVDTEIFSLRNYLSQTKRGFQQLFKTHEVKMQNIVIIALTMITVINGQILIDTQLVAEGWNARELGIITAIMFILSAGFGQLTPWVSKRFGQWNGFILTAGVIAITMIFVPIAGVILGTFMIMGRQGIAEIFGNNASAMINNTTESKYRATTLSTYTMLSNIPYVLTAFFLGYLMDVWSVHGVTAVLGSVLMIIVLGAYLRKPKVVLAR
ncbi:MAG: MFS transporter [Candidatus Roizmanbacteria bacterium]|nr:MFS transporter [Candidatus Roizmanbacteria bacterium]